MYKPEKGIYLYVQYLFFHLNIHRKWQKHQTAIPLRPHPPLKTPNQWISCVWIWDFDTCE